MKFEQGIDKFPVRFEIEGNKGFWRKPLTTDSEKETERKRRKGGSRETYAIDVEDG